jgi:hypothetical protein
LYGGKPWEDRSVEIDDTVIVSSQRECDELIYINYTAI